MTAPGGCKAPAEYSRPTIWTILHCLVWKHSGQQVLCCGINWLFCFSSLLCKAWWTRHIPVSQPIFSNHLKFLELAVQRIKTMWTTGGRVPLKTLRTQAQDKAWNIKTTLQRSTSHKSSIWRSYVCAGTKVHIAQNKQVVYWFEQARLLHNSFTEWIKIYDSDVSNKNSSSMMLGHIRC